jgi:hypothetical protein
MGDFTNDLQMLESSLEHLIHFLPQEPTLRKCVVVIRRPEKDAVEAPCIEFRLEEFGVLLFHVDFGNYRVSLLGGHTESGETWYMDYSPSGDVIYHQQHFPQSEIHPHRTQLLWKEL